QHAIVLLDVRHDIGKKILNKFIRWRCSAATWLCDAWQGPPTRRARVSGRHDDNHWPGLFHRDRVVENEASAPDRCPRIVTIARAVQQVEDGEFTLPQFITRRRVDVHSTEFAERG